MDVDGYPVYGRREHAKTIPKNEVIIDNRNIVSYNPNLLPSTYQC